MNLSRLDVGHAAHPLEAQPDQVRVAASVGPTTIESHDVEPGPQPRRASKPSEKFSILQGECALCHEIWMPVFQLCLHLELVVAHDSVVCCRISRQTLDVKDANMRLPVVSALELNLKCVEDQARSSGGSRTSRHSL